ncbi:hypothetical protein WJX77_003222 [Trebouxia sp. C0004]
MKPGIKSGQCCERGVKGIAYIVSCTSPEGWLPPTTDPQPIGKGFADDLQLASNVHKGVASLAMYCLPHWQLV